MEDMTLFNTVLYDSLITITILAFCHVRDHTNTLRYWDPFRLQSCTAPCSVQKRAVAPSSVADRFVQTEAHTKGRNLDTRQQT